jgi:hypothetical protein
VKFSCGKKRRNQGKERRKNLEGGVQPYFKIELKNETEGSMKMLTSQMTL